ncbi:T9SS type A sorting domain-containing protein [candidate division KSB1 bacterium]|nr:T9SS type A sorting domain-containing protein [candidate division KSB1 bacterium]
MKKRNCIDLSILNYISSLVLILIMLLSMNTNLTAEEDVIVTGAGKTEVNGTYEYMDYMNGKPRWHLSGTNYYIWWNLVFDGQWQVYGGDRWYFNSAATPKPPHDGWELGSGGSPAPNLWGDVYIPADNILVTGAGKTDVNGLYEPNGEMNGKPKWLHKNGNYYLWWNLVFDGQWQIYFGNRWYFNTNNTSYPPHIQWQVGSGAEPAPTLSGNVDTSLPVHLSGFTARQEKGYVLLEWATESETDNLGFILERKTTETVWNRIASYETHEILAGRESSTSVTKYTYIDNNILPGVTYSYRLSDVNITGKINIDDVITITTAELPRFTELKLAYPNPFNPDTRIVYSLAEDAMVTLKIINTMGQTIRTLIIAQNQSIGTYTVHWDGRDQNGDNVSTGIYLPVLTAGDVVKSQKIMLVR